VTNLDYVQCKGLIVGTNPAITDANQGTNLATNPIPTPGFFTTTTTDNITAHAGGGQANATPLTTSLNRVTTVASAGDSVVLPASFAGAEITVINAAAANSMNVFPAVGDAINALGANNAFAVAAGKTATFYCATAGQLHSILSA
jgi:hypothetical protein